MLTTKINKQYKKWLIAFFVLLLTAAGIIWYLFTLKYDDTADVKAEHTVNALAFIGEFKTSLGAANKKYTEKIVVVNGNITKIEPADTTVNIIIADTASDAYIIFAFQQQHLAEAKKMMIGDNVSIKGSCSGGAFSSILETEYITFKRCAVNK